MPEEKYAPELLAKDQRLQDLGWEDEEMEDWAVESVPLQPEFAVKEGAEMAKAVDEEKFLAELDEEALEKVKEDADAIMADGGASDDKKAAAEMAKKIATRQKEEKAKQKAKIPTRYSKSFDMFSSLVFYEKPDPDLEPEKYEKIKHYSEIRWNGQEYLINIRFFATGSLLLDEKALKAEEEAEYEMGAPAQPAEKYEDEPPEA